ncbi:Uma2 family endonuclease [Cyanobacterium aponinum UTEX 3221]|uniref:Uma2 family endonuclease n=1 Tax=Cyanobacterium aponinum TaxID=379064 RepID=UPI002B4BAB86|nr:Uma2 family endonuclease [Cyanobacterium aponinum]WRL37328.1 Uma2 family endonuclease [Cyanobacterium aponinum UTEX 3221]
MTLSVEHQIIYPESDGQPMADNTKQFRWIVFLKENLECLFANNSNVFVAGDLLWYPQQGKPDIRVAPDVMVVFGRAKGDRGSYRQWEEDNIAPQVVFEIISPSNTMKEMLKKQQFYERYEVEEYYIYDPDRHDFTGFQRINDKLTLIDHINTWISPRLGIKFVFTQENLKVYYPDESPFLTTIELKQKADAEKQRADMEKQRADSAELELAKLKQFLQQQGIDLPKSE